jgi:SpoVK/Ycf46/Vps4 family AAA+-type ATPase
MSYTNINDYNILLNNVTNLKDIQINEYNNIKNEYYKLVTQIEIIKNNFDELNKKYKELENVNKSLEITNNILSSLVRNVKNKNENDTIDETIITKYKPFITSPTNISWSDDYIKNVISSINTIEDIIKLNYKWKYLKHNITLQRLYYLIPPLIKLNNMIGLTNIKESIFKKIIYYINKENNDEYLHTIISGEPGVGNTEFAKIYADIFVRLGILKTNKFIEIKRSDLIGTYLGHTTQKTTELLDRANGGVLFLDEAYSIGHDDNKDSYAKEAIDLINLYLSKNKNSFMFIIAGYENKLNECFFQFNPGLKRRFHSHYKIEGYTSHELKQIFIKKIYKSKYYLNINDKILDEFFKENKNVFKYFGGDIDKLVDEIKYVQSFRLFTENKKSNEIIMDDIIESLKIIKDNTEKQPILSYIS